MKLHVGLFEDTLPAFVAAHPDSVRFINVDCDLYSATKCIFDGLSGRIGAGSVLAFDEYIVNDRWRDDEFKAFQEAVQRCDWRYTYEAFSIHQYQGVVRVL